MENKKVCYVTADNYLDTDTQIIKYIYKSFRFTWFVVFSKTYTGYSQEQIDKYSKENKIHTRSFKLNYRFRNPRIIVQYLKFLREIKKINADIIYFNILGYPYLFPLIYILIGRKKTIYAVHDFLEHVNIKHRFIIQTYQRFIFILFKNFQLYSKEQYALFNQIYKKKNTFLAPFCLKDFGESNASPPKDLIKFLFFGIIRENKGLDYLIKAANRLALVHKGKFKVTIAGSCDNWDKYSTLIDDKDVFDLKIQVIENEMIPNIFKSAHYTILPYLDVTQSGVLFISYNYCTPVIASKHAWFESYIQDGENGFIFENQNIESLFRVMEKIILSNNKNYCSIKAKLNEFIDRSISHHSVADEYVKFFNSF